MKELFKRLILLAIAMVLTNKINSQVEKSLAISCDLKLDGQSSDLNLFHIVITDDESNEVTFSSKEHFSCDLKLDHLYTITLNSDGHTTLYIYFDTHGNIKEPLMYEFEVNLLLTEKDNDKNSLCIGKVAYDENTGQFLCSKY